MRNFCLFKFFNYWCLRLLQANSEDVNTKVVDYLIPNDLVIAPFEKDREEFMKICAQDVEGQPDLFQIRVCVRFEKWAANKWKFSWWIGKVLSVSGHGLGSLL